ncbi:MAG: hypothetical protein HY983_04060 [Candidatus Magasanikbacteria bacterium]|nr:hypothetical protein [Candidatus Magasanikbacteria bacterium]
MLNKRTLTKPILYGLAASLTLLAFYFSILTLVSGWIFAQKQFGNYWYYIVSLAVGFGIQIGLYAYLKNALRQRGAGKVLAVSGGTGATAMISCCAHYLVNIAPALGAAGVLSLIAGYQIQLFWIGLAFNLGGIIFIAHKLFKFKSLV